MMAEFRLLMSVRIAPGRICEKKTYGEVGDEPAVLVGDDCEEVDRPSCCVMIRRDCVWWSLNDFCFLLLIDFPAL